MAFTVEQIKLKMRQIESVANRENGGKLSEGQQAEWDSWNALLNPQPVVRSMPLDGNSPGDAPGDYRRNTAPANRSGMKCFKSFDSARSFGRFCQAIAGNRGAEKWLESNGIDIGASMLEGTNTAGGYLVPQQFSRDIVDLRNESGVFKRNARIVPMTSDKINIPRRTASSTVYGVGEADDITASDLSFDQITLTLKKAGIITVLSNELSEDALISIADYVAYDMAQQLAAKEDACGFVGDGSTDYLSITGVVTKLSNAAGNPTTTSAGGIIVANDKDWADINIASLIEVMGLLPVYAEKNAKWYCSKAFFGQCMARLAYSAGGTTVQDMANGMGRQFLGFPVEIVQDLPSAQAVSQVCCLFGDLSLAAAFGDRQEIAIASATTGTIGSTNLFTADCQAIRAIERFDIVVHDVGNTTTAGPIVGLQTLNA